MADRPGLWTRIGRLPGGAGLLLAAISVPLIVMLGEGGSLVALAVLCVYPVLDVPRTLAGRSWWLSALLSAVVWLIVFAVLTGIADSVHHLGDDAMIFLLPFMLYPLALGVAGLVRLEGWLQGRPPETGPRRAAIFAGIACGLFAVVPAALNTIPVLTEKVTGNTPPNTVYSSDGDVISATATELSVRDTASRTESFVIGPDTGFAFRGPGSPAVTGPAGPAWLKPGQRIGLEYIYRDRVAHVRYITIWIERKGCAGEARWTAAAHAGDVTGTIPSLVGSTWQGHVGDAASATSRDRTTFIFLDGNRLAYQDDGSTRQEGGEWKQDGASVILEVNDCYALYEGRIDADVIRGTFSNEVGARAEWTAQRMAAGR